MNKRENAMLVDALGAALSDEEHSFNQVPRLLRRILEERSWQEFETKMGNHITYTNFADFVNTPPLDGLGSNLDLIKRIVGDNIELRELLANALRQTAHRPKKQEESMYVVHTLEKKEKKQEQYGRRALQLKKKHPDLYAQVLSGEKTEYAAAIEAGIDRPTMHVTLDSPKSAAKLIAKASPEFLEELRRLL